MQTVWLLLVLDLEDLIQLSRNYSAIVPPPILEVVMIQIRRLSSLAHLLSSVTVVIYYTVDAHEATLSMVPLACPTPLLLRRCHSVSAVS